MSGSNCCFLTCMQVSQETSKVVWYSISLRIFQFVVIPTVKGFSIINDAEADVFLEFPCFLCDPELESESCCSVASNSLWPMDYTVHGVLQARILEWVAFPFCRGSSQPSDQTQVSCIAGGFCPSWGTREAQEYWSGQPIPSWEDLPNPGIEPESPVLQVDSLSTE